MIGSVSFCTGFCIFPENEETQKAEGPVSADQGARDFPAPGSAASLEPAESVLSFVLVAKTFSISSFVGLTLTTTHGLVDTGAQHGVIGQEQYECIVAFLRTHGLKPRSLPTQRGGATGVGGESQFILTSEVPTAIKGVCGTVRLNVLSEPVPFLLPVSFSEHLGMILNMPEKSIYWKHIDRKQEYV